MSTLIDAVAKAQVSDRLREAERRRAGVVYSQRRPGPTAADSGSDT